MTTDNFDSYYSLVVGRLGSKSAESLTIKRFGSPQVLTWEWESASELARIFSVLCTFYYRIM